MPSNETGLGMEVLYKHHREKGGLLSSHAAEPQDLSEVVASHSEGAA